MHGVIPVTVVDQFNQPYKMTESEEYSISRHLLELDRDNRMKISWVKNIVVTRQESRWVSPSVLIHGINNENKSILIDFRLGEPPKFAQNRRAA